MNAVPATMRAAVMYAAGDVRIEERPVPSLESGDLLVRMGASGICSGDLIDWYVARKAPLVFGHEPSGTVVAAGVGSPPEDEALIGSRIFAHHHTPCLVCRACEKGRYVQCSRWRSTALDPGAMAEFFRVPRSNRAEVRAIPQDVPFVAASLIEPLACVVKSLRRGTGAPVRWSGETLEQTLRGCSVYVVGLGIMGLLHVVLARALGAEVFGSDFVAQRRVLATALGASAFSPEEALEGLHRATEGAGADIVVCGPGTSKALAHALNGAAAGGTVVMFAPFRPEERFVLDQSDVYFRDLRLLGSYSAGPDDTAASHELVVHRMIAPERLGVSTWPLCEAPQAYAAMESQSVVKAVVLGSPA